MALGVFMETYAPLTRAELERCLDGVESAALREAMGHLLGRGKLLRPLVVLAAYEACGGSEGLRPGPAVVPDRRAAGPTRPQTGPPAPPAQGEPAPPATEAMVPYAAAFELIHTFTLIHDDLPCMDDAELRRGVAAVHIAAGEATAVLAGDALLNLAFARLSGEDSPVGQAAVPAKVVGAEHSSARDDVASKGGGPSTARPLRQDAEPQAGPPAPPVKGGTAPPDRSGLVTAEQRLALVETAARATHLVVEGQVLDLESEGRKLSVEELQQLHRKKTGALLAACCAAGGILAGAEVARRSALWEAGEQLGLVFQIRDDLLSVTGSEAQVGKSLGVDEAQDKATYPRLLGVAEAEAMLERELARCTEMIEGMGLAHPELLLQLAQLSANRDR